MLILLLSITCCGRFWIFSHENRTDFESWKNLKISGFFLRWPKIAILIQFFHEKNFKPHHNKWCSNDDLKANLAFEHNLLWWVLKFFSWKIINFENFVFCHWNILTEIYQIFKKFDAIFFMSFSWVEVEKPPQQVGLKRIIRI